jgi:DNA repair exonuclease SbcCD ATPase subunit
VKVEVDNNHIDIYIDRPIYNGRLILLNNASGFERFISSLAIRMALLDISQLPKPNFIAIDEGWTSFDYQNINNVRTIFDFLIQKFDFVLSISHLSQIKEHCQHQIHLKKDKDDFSVIC